MARIRGTKGPDTLNGTEFADAIRGLGYYDTLHGWGGDDLIDGGRDGDLLFGDLGNDTIYGRAGGDEIYGGDGNDVIWAGDADDYADGGAGDDFIAGGKGNDFIGDGEGWNDIRGGVGDDIVGGSGQVFGGPGNDIVGMGGGIFYGDDILGQSRGDDTFLQDARHQKGSSIAIGGQGADAYRIEFCNDGIATRIDVLDFRQIEGDRFDAAVENLPGLPGAWTGNLGESLDTNGDHVIDGRDPAGAHGVTWADPYANAVCLLTADGDLLALWGTQSVTLDYFI